MPTSASLDDLILLNREISAMVKAGIPLELGLRGLSGNVSTRLGRLSERLSLELAAGRSLPEALAAEGPSVSPVYTAVMEAGLASGRLPEALQSLEESGRVIQETRQRVLLAILYPALCCAVGYALFCLFLLVITPQLLHAADMFRFPQTWAFDALQFLHRHRGLILLAIPAAYGLAILMVMFLGNRASRARRGLSPLYNGIAWFFSNLPGSSLVLRFLEMFDWLNPASLHRSLNWSQFTELLALQIEQNTPLPRAFSLAAQSTDDVRWQAEGEHVAQQLADGVSLGDALKSATLMPPMMSWMLASSGNQSTLAATLRQLSETYRRRAIQQAAALKTWIPVIMTVCVAGGISLAYALAFFFPLRALLFGLTHE